jgi:hypothetical protein
MDRRRKNSGGPYHRREGVATPAEKEGLAGESGFPMIQRRNTRQIKVGGVPVGGGALISVQSMTNTATEDVAATVAQLRRPGRSRASRRRSGSRSSRTSISTIGWPSPPQGPEPTACGSTPATSADPGRSKRSSIAPGTAGSRSASASIRGRSKRTCSRNTKGPRRKAWWPAPCGM